MTAAETQVALQEFLGKILPPEKGLRAKVTVLEEPKGYRFMVELDLAGELAGRFGGTLPPRIARVELERACAALLLGALEAKDDGSRGGVVARLRKPAGEVGRDP